MSVAVATSGVEWDGQVRADCHSPYDRIRVDHAGGPVPYMCRSERSSKPLGVRRPRGFFLTKLNVDGAGYGSRLCIGK